MKRTSWTGPVAVLLVALAVTVGCQSPPDPEARTTGKVEEKDKVEEKGDAEPPVPVPPADAKALAEANNRFGIGLYRKLAADWTGDVFLSPYSISAALAMTYAGARGETAAQMATVLGIDKLGDRVHPAHAGLAGRLRGDGKDGRPEFHVANALWGQKGLPFERDFLTLTKRHYGAGLREADYVADHEAARGAINKWVGEQTRDMIPQLIHAGEVTEDTRLVLVNAIYFKGLWATPFVKANTKPEPFWKSADKSVDVPTMHQSLEVSFHEGDGFKVVRLPYGDGSVGMVLVVPDARDGLPAVERKLTAKAVRGWFAKRTTAHVDLSLPQFKSKARFKLARTLADLGMRRPFGIGGKADFSGITTATDLAISEVVHEAVVEVNEEGTKGRRGDRGIYDPAGRLASAAAASLPAGRPAVPAPDRRPLGRDDPLPRALRRAVRLATHAVPRPEGAVVYSPGGSPGRRSGTRAGPFGADSRFRIAPRASALGYRRRPLRGGGGRLSAPLALPAMPFTLTRSLPPAFPRPDSPEFPR